jgi:hypothetical protein
VRVRGSRYIASAKVLIFVETDGASTAGSGYPIGEQIRSKKATTSIKKRKRPREDE